MFIVDSQVHVWGAETPARPWPDARRSRKPHRAIPLGREELLREMDAAGVTRTVIVPPQWEGDRNDLGLEAARLYPDRFAVMGRFVKEAPDAREQIANWRKQPGLLGMRLTFTIQDSDDWVWDALQAAGVPVMIAAGGQLPAIERAAQRFPGLKIALDHLAIPSRSLDEQAFAHMDTLLALAKYPNIAVKASSMTSYSTEPYPHRNIHSHLRRVYDAYGPRRMFWGSDLTKLKCPYRQAITLFTEELPWLTADDKAWIMGRGVCAWIGWPLPPGV